MSLTTSLASLTGLRESNSVFAPASASTPLTGSAAKRRRKGTLFSFRLDRPATVNLAIQTAARGRLVGHSCRAATHRLRKKRPCTRLIAIKTLTRTGHAGLNKVPFTGRIAKRALKPGHYRASFTAVNGGGSSRPQVLRFTIVKR